MFADVTSANVVGYQNFALDTEAGRQFKMVATQFAPMNDTGKWTFDTKIFDQEMTPGDCVYFFDKALEDRVYYYYLGVEGDIPMWVKMWTDGVTGEPLEDWTITSVEVSKSETLYWQPADGETSAIVNGQVEDLNGVTVTFPDSAPYNLVNPYPIDTTLAELENFFQPGDNLYIFDEALEDRVYFYYLGDNMWVKMWTDGVTGEPMEDWELTNDYIVLKVGQGGVFNACDDAGREWIVSLQD